MSPERQRATRLKVPLQAILMFTVYSSAPDILLIHSFCHAHHGDVSRSLFSRHYVAAFSIFFFSSFFLIFSILRHFLH